MINLIQREKMETNSFIYKVFFNQQLQKQNCEQKDLTENNAILQSYRTFLSAKGTYGKIIYE